jgi:hypothetical protein
MCNCNQKRVQYSSGTSSKRQQGYQEGMVQMQLIQTPPFTIYGDITGREYSFLEAKQILWVDKRDSAHFDAEGIVRV